MSEDFDMMTPNAAGSRKPSHDFLAEKLLNQHERNGRYATSNKLDEFTPERAMAFCTALAASGHIGRACQATKLSRASVKAWRSRYEDFDKAVEYALELGTEMLEDEAVRRAQLGVDEPVFYKDAVVGSVRKYSDNLLMFLLSARRPEKYRKDAQVNINIDVAQQLMAARKRINGGEVQSG
ncbi:MAG: hypothetical protein ACRDAJ_06935 [Serratia fonticola]